jgi:hypothetical protein
MVRTVISMSAQDDDLDEARNALWALATGPFGPVEVHRPGGDGPTYLTVSVAGDVRVDVRRHLEQYTLPYELDLREDL